MSVIADPNPPVTVTLAWDSSPGPSIAGYRLYAGVSSSNYTNIIDVGDITMATVSNLTVGTTYYFAVSAYDALGLESELSTELSHTVTPRAAELRLSVGPQTQPVLTATGPAGYTFELLTTTNLENWVTLTNITMGSDGTCRFTDLDNPVAANQMRLYRLRQISP